MTKLSSTAIALPSLFISHGSPMLALDAGSAGTTWQRLATELPKPIAVVIMSAHWETAVPTLSTALQLPTVHDFGGFPEALYRIQYPARGAPEIAQRAKRLLDAAGFEVALDSRRGLDHGAWVPLREMFADASVPIVQLSLQPHSGPAHHYRIGRALAPLAAENILLIGSGSLTHNLHEAFSAMHSAAQPEFNYVREFQQWIYAMLRSRDIESLLAYRTKAPYAQRAHPSDEHLLPLFFALGAAGDYTEAIREYAAVDLSALAMDVYRFISSPPRAP